MKGNAIKEFPTPWTSFVPFILGAMSEQRWKGTRVPSCWDGGHLSPTSKILGACLYTHLWGTHYNGNLIVQKFLRVWQIEGRQVGMLTALWQKATGGAGHSLSGVTDDSADGNVCSQFLCSIPNSVFLFFTPTENKKGGRLWMRLLWRAPGMPVCCWRSGELDSTTAKKPGWLGVLPPKETTWGSFAIYLWAAMAQRLTCRLTNHQWWKTQDVPASSCLFLEYPLGITGLFQMQAFCEILKR